MPIIIPDVAAPLTLAGLRSAIQAKGFGTDTVAAQTSAINSAYRRVVGMRQFSWLIISANTAATVNENVVTFAPVTQMQEPIEVRAALGTDKYDLEYVHPTEFARLKHLDDTPALPTQWTYLSGTIQVYPRPDFAYTMTVTYVQDPPVLVNDGDVPVIPDTHADVLVWGAIAELAFRERDIPTAQHANGEYNIRVKEMMTSEGIRQRQTRSVIQRSGFWPERE